jgi:hypothetical protein
MALAALLFPHLIERRPELPGVVFEALGQDLGRLQSLTQHELEVATRSTRYALANGISRVAAELPDTERWIDDLLWTGFRLEQDFDPGEVARVSSGLARTLATRGARP